METDSVVVEPSVTATEQLEPLSPSSPVSPKIVRTVLEDPPSCFPSLQKTSFYVFTLVTWVCIVGLIMASIWLCVYFSETSLLSLITNISSNPVMTALIFILSSALMLVGTAIIGLCALCTDRGAFINLCYALSVLSLVLQIIAVGMITPLYKQVSVHLGAGMSDSLSNHYGQRGQDSVTNAWNLIQIKGKCCGVVNGSDEWAKSEWNRRSFEDEVVNGSLTLKYFESQRGSPRVPESCCANMINPLNETDPHSDNLALCYKAAFNQSMPDREKYFNTVGCKTKVESAYNSGLTVFLVVICPIFIVVVLILAATRFLTRNMQFSYNVLL